MGAEEQIVDDPERALAQYARPVPGAETHLIAGAGHSPNVEKPARDAPVWSRICQTAPEGPKICRTRRYGARRSSCSEAPKPSQARFWGSQRYCQPVALRHAPSRTFAHSSEPFPTAHLQVPLQRRCRPRASVPYEPMFDSKQTLTDRLADAVDLLIDFATPRRVRARARREEPRPSCETRSRTAAAACARAARCTLATQR